MLVFARVRFSQVRVVQEILQVVQLTYLEVLLRLLQRNLLVLLILLLRLKLKLVIHSPKVLVPPAALLYDKVFRLSENVYNSLDLVVFGVSWKNGKAKKQFDHYASQRPDVYGCCVRHLQDNLRRAVEPGLYVRVYFFVLLAR